MYKILRAICLAVFPLVIVGCSVGKDFVRPSSDALQLGRTSYAQVLQQMGEPKELGNLRMNDKVLTLAKYVYAASTLLEETLEKGVIPARVLQCYFHNETLVGLVFLSTIKSDNSDFDSSKVEQLKKGQTTRAEAIQIFGKPTASLIPPVVKATSGEAIGYSYQAIRTSPFSGAKMFSKTLRISFDEHDRVSDVEYQSSGDSNPK